MLLGQERQTGTFVQISYFDEVHVFDLTRDKTFSLPNMPNVTFEISGGKVAFVKSDCPTQICVNMGFQSRVGQMAVCLPNGLIITVVGEGGELDVFVR